MLTTRVLPRDEWSRLAGTEAAALQAAPLGFPAQVLVVEDERGDIVATWALITRYEVEGLWVRPDHRGKPAVFRRLGVEMMRLARSLGIFVLRTAANDDQVAAMVEAAGGSEFDRGLRHFVMPVRGGV